MTRNYSNTTPPSGSYWRLILIGVGVFGSLTLFTMNWLENRKFEEAVQAYESGQCEQAIADKVIQLGDRQPSDDGSDRIAKAIVYRQECRTYQSIVAANQPAQMLGMAGQFAERYPNSSLSFPLGEALALNLVRHQSQSWGGILLVKNSNP